jgi:uncharacterized protein (DUF4415 family)
MKRSRTTPKDETDYARLDAMTDEDIDFSDIPETTPEMFARGVRVPPLNVREPREELTVTLDRDLAKWYRDMGPQCHGIINFLLRRYMQEELRKPARPKARRA